MQGSHEFIHLKKQKNYINTFQTAKHLCCQASEIGSITMQCNIHVLLLVSYLY